MNPPDNQKTTGTPRGARSTARVAAWAIALGGAIGLTACATPTAPDDHTVLRAMVAPAHTPAPPALPDGGTGEAKALLESPLTAERAVTVAILQNRDILAAVAALGIQRADVIDASLAANPRLAAQVRPTTQMYADPTSVLGQGGFPSTEIEMEWSLVELLFMPQRRGAAQARLQSERLQVADQVVGLARDVRIAYYNVQAKVQVEALQRQMAVASQAASDTASELFRVGNATELSMNMERAALENARIRLQNAQAETQYAREDLNRMMGVFGPDIAWTLADPLASLPPADPSLDQLESHAMVHRLDLQALDEALVADKAALQLARTSGWLPGLDVGVSGERDPDGTVVVGPRVSVALPVFDRQQGDAARAKAMIRTHQQQSAGRAIHIRSEVRVARAKLQRARALVEHYEKTILPLKRNIVELTQREYNYMLTGVFQLIAMRTDEVQAQSDHVEALRAYWVARADVQRAIGGHFHDLKDAP